MICARRPTECRLDDEEVFVFLEVGSDTAVKFVISHYSTYWADLCFPADALRCLLDRRRPIVGANYVARGAHHPFAALRDWRNVKTTADSTGIEAVDHIGLGSC